MSTSVRGRGLDDQHQDPDGDERNPDPGPGAGALAQQDTGEYRDQNHTRFVRIAAWFFVEAVLPFVEAMWRDFNVSA